MSIFIKAIECFVSAVVFGLLPTMLGFILGRITVDHFEHLKKLIIRLDNEGKLLDSEKEMFLRMIDELKAEREAEKDGE